jgi:hypothetical protein
VHSAPVAADEGNRRVLMRSLINRVSSVAAANRSISSISILITDPVRRSRSGIERILISSDGEGNWMAPSLAITRANATATISRSR